jgi:hypothetical protein
MTEVPCSVSCLSGEFEWSSGHPSFVRGSTSDHRPGQCSIGSGRAASQSARPFGGPGGSMPSQPGGHRRLALTQTRTRRRGVEGYRSLRWSRSTTTLFRSCPSLWIDRGGLGPVDRGGLRTSDLSTYHFPGRAIFASVGEPLEASGRGVREDYSVTLWPSVPLAVRCPERGSRGGVLTLSKVPLDCIELPLGCAPSRLHTFPKESLQVPMTDVLLQL